MLVLIAPYLYGQSGSCNFKKNEVDDMTGLKVLVTKERRLRIALYKSLTVKGRKVNNTYMLHFLPTAGSIFSMDPGARVLIKTREENKVYEIHSNEYELSTGIHSSGFSVYSSEIQSTVDYSIINALSKETVNKIRFYFNDGYVDYPINHEGAKKLKSICRCLIDN